MMPPVENLGLAPAEEEDASVTSSTSSTVARGREVEGPASAPSGASVASVGGGRSSPGAMMGLGSRWMRMDEMAREGTEGGSRVLIPSWSKNPSDVVHRGRALGADVRALRSRELSKARRVEVKWPDAGTRLWAETSDTQGGRKESRRNKARRSGSVIRLPLCLAIT